MKQNMDKPGVKFGRNKQSSKKQFCECVSQVAESGDQYAITRVVGQR